MRPRGGPDRILSRALPVVVLAAFGCGPDDGVSPLVAPEVVDAMVAANASNALSLVVTVTTEGADSVLVRYGRVGEALEHVSGAVPVLDGGPSTIPVLGLLPETAYALQPVALNDAGWDEGTILERVTGMLPSDLPAYAAGGPDPSPGYVVFAAGRYGLVIDNDGRVVWYHAFPSGPGLNFQPQPNGRYVARPPPSDPLSPSPWVEIDPLGNVTRTLTCARGLSARFHDLIVSAEGDYWIMCDETRTMDLSTVGGVAQAHVTGTVIQHLDSSGRLLFEWSPFEHFAITDLDPASRTGESVNWTHGNALDLDSDGNLVVSFRSLSEITKIDVESGDVMWRMGGLRNQFVFLDAPTPAFARQHGVRLTGEGRLLLLDNSGDATQTRAERYEFDARGGVARLIGSLGPTPAVRAQLGGTTQDLPGGRALVAFGDGGKVQEYDAVGNVVWEIEGNAGYVFRAERIASLYRPGAAANR